MPARGSARAPRTGEQRGAPPSIRRSPRPRTSVDPALRQEEVTRTRVFFRLVLAVSLLTAAFIPFLEGLRWLRLAAVVLCSTAALVCTVLLVVLREPKRYTPTLSATVAVVCAALGVAVIYYIGVFSAGVMILNLGVYFFGNSRHRRTAWAAYATVAVLYFIAAVGISAGLLPDLALFSASEARPLTRWFQTLMSEVIFGATFFLARSSQRATEQAVRRVHDARRALRQREAMLAEAKGELARANRPGEGRYSGREVDGYSVGERIGRGAMGEVYKCQDRMGRPLAIKFLHIELVENPKKIKRFLREAEAASAVSGANIPRLYATGWLDDGVPYLVMDLLDGHDLGWHLRRSGTLDLPDVVEMVEQVARALADVRDAGVVHRDLKPANVFLADTLPRTWKVLDFGLSKLTWETGSLTRGNAVGTPSYMAPEQVSGPEVDHQADLYALTALAYRALAGTPPFSGDEVSHVLFQVVNEQPPSPVQLAGVSEDVELVLALGMAKARERRFARVEELATAFRQAVEGRLAAEWRQRGHAILRDHPWGSRKSDAA